MDRVQQRATSNAKLEMAANEAGASEQIAACAAKYGKSDKMTEDTVLYIVGEVTSGTTELFKQLTSEKQKVGFTNFDGEKLNSGRNAVIDAISITVATSTSATSPAGLDFSEKADPAILNAIFSWTNGRKKVIELPVFDVHNPNTTRSNDELFRGLGHLPILEANEINKCDFEFPVGVTPDVTGGKRHWVRIALRVNQTISR